MRGISKTFPGVKALNDVQLKAWGGEVLALMGENGAGKSTLMKILSGAYQADPGGEILIDGKPVAITDPIAAKRHGIAIIYQELALAPNLTVAENIYLGSEPSPRRPASTAGPWSAGCAAGAGAPRRPVHADDTVSAACRSPSSSWSRSPARCTPSRKILVLDEPTTALSSRETERLFAPDPPAARRRASRSSTSAIAWPRSTSSPTASPCCATAAMSARSTATSSRAEALVKMMVGRDLSSFYKKEHDPHGSRGTGRARGARHRPMAASACIPAASSCIGARCWASPAWSAPAAPNSPA